VILLINKKQVKGNLILLLTAFIWGSAFVAQRVGAQSMGSFSFNGIRFLLGATFLTPIMIYLHPKRSDFPLNKDLARTKIPGAILGTVLFIATSLQQIGLIYTTAGKAAFITGMYIIFVPIAGIFFKQTLTLKTILSSFIALIGLFFLMIESPFIVNIGDVLQLLGAFFWTAHIILIDRYVQKYDALKLSVFQFLITALLSGFLGIIFELNTVAILKNTLIPILYGGILSVGVAYTLQIVGQQYAKPSHAAIILSLEVVFGVLAGVILLNEILTLRGYIGATMMFFGMILSQLEFKKTKRT
jgi:drug/metabolite transporter (DMT)-like permease